MHHHLDPAQPIVHCIEVAEVSGPKINLHPGRGRQIEHAYLMTRERAQHIRPKTTGRTGNS
jgi:hypothetical protein